MKFFKRTAVLLAVIMCFTPVLSAVGQSVTYSEYIETQSAETAVGAEKIVIGGESCVSGEEVERLENYMEKEGVTLRISDESDAVFRFDVPSAGKYNIILTYYCGGKNAYAIERDIYIDGSIPFEEASAVSFPQPWEDASKEKQYDIYGNEIRAKRQPKEGWMDYCAYDVTGKISQPLSFYLTAGSHELTLAGVGGTLILNKIVFSPVETVPDYSEVKAKYKAEGYKNAAAPVTVQAEDGVVSSDRSVYPLSDKTSPSVSPYSYSAQLYNAVGGTQWQLFGQWLEWQFTVDEDALYKLGFHFKQSDKSGDVSIRECYIDGSLPFREAAAITFEYDSSWQFKYFANEDEPYLFYLTAGTHTLRLKVGWGGIAESIAEAEECLEMLNKAYRRIVVITGSSPDTYRDYQLDSVIPEVF